MRTSELWPLYAFIALSSGLGSCKLSVQGLPASDAGTCEAQDCGFSCPDGFSRDQGGCLVCDCPSTGEKVRSGYYVVSTKESSFSEGAGIVRNEDGCDLRLHEPMSAVFDDPQLDTDALKREMFHWEVGELKRGAVWLKGVSVIKENEEPELTQHGMEKTITFRRVLDFSASPVKKLFKDAGCPVVEACERGSPCTALYNNCTCDWGCFFGDEPPPLCERACPEILQPKPACECKGDNCKALRCATDPDCPPGYACQDGICKEDFRRRMIYDSMDVSEACTKPVVAEGEAIKIRVSGFASACEPSFAGCSVYYEPYIGNWAAGTIHVFPFVAHDANGDYCDEPRYVDGECEFTPPYMGGYAIGVNNFIVLHVDVDGGSSQHVPPVEVQCEAVGVTPMFQCNPAPTTGSDAVCITDDLQPGEPIRLTLSYECADCFDMAGFCRTTIAGNHVTADLRGALLHCQCPSCGACAPECRELRILCMTPPLPAGDYTVEALPEGDYSVTVREDDSTGEVCMERGRE